MTDTLTIARPDDWHLHFRDGDLLAETVPATANVFGRAHKHEHHGDHQCVQIAISDTGVGMKKENLKLADQVQYIVKYFKKQQRIYLQMHPVSK